MPIAGEKVNSDASTAKPVYFSNPPVILFPATATLLQAVTRYLDTLLDYSYFIWRYGFAIGIRRLDSSSTAR